MGFWEIVVLVSSLASLAMGAGTMIWAALQDKPGGEAGKAVVFQGPRANYGDPIPYVFGTVEVESPLCVYGSGVLTGSPFVYWPWRSPDFLRSQPLPDSQWFFGESEPGTAVFSGRPGFRNGFRVADQDRQRIQAAASIDLILSERVFSDGAPVGTATLFKIWLGDELLWNSTQWASPGLSVSGNLLEVDPNRYAPPPAMAGGGTTPYSGGGWWFGGIRERTPGADSGEVIGDWPYLWDFSASPNQWTHAGGLEQVHFYIGDGSETENAWVAGLLFGADAGTEPWAHYQSFNKFTRLVFEAFCWGFTNSIPRITAELRISVPAPEIGDEVGLMPNQRDVNPVSLLWVLLTNPEFLGNDKMPALDTASFAAARATVYEENAGMSYRLQSSTKASSLVEEIVKHIDGILYLDPVTNLLTLKLNRLETGSIPSFSERIVKSVSSFEKTTWEATYSEVRVNFQMRTSAPNEKYAKNVAIARDEALSVRTGNSEKLEDAVDTVFEADYANELAARKLAVANTPLVTFEIQATRETENGNTMMNLRPGSTFRLSYAPLGIEEIRCKVLSIDFGTLEENRLVVKVIQDRYSSPPIVAPPPRPQSPPAPRKPVATIEHVKIASAPYHIARLGLPGDGRAVFTNSAIATATSTNPYPYTTSGFNFDRWLLLVKAPSASRFSNFSVRIVDDSTSEVVETMLEVPYTPGGALATAINHSQGGDNFSYTGISTTPFTIEGLYEGEAQNFFKSGERRDGSNVILVNNEWMLVLDYTILDSTSVRIDEYQRMIWDSPGDYSQTTGRPTHPVGSRVWLVDVTNPLTVRKLSSLYRSGDCIVTNETGVNGTDYGVIGGLVGNQLGLVPIDAFRRFWISNSNSQTQNNIFEFGPYVLENRAARLHPFRQLYIVGMPSGTNGYARNTFTTANGVTSLVFGLGVIGEVTGSRQAISSTNPRDALSVVPNPAGGVFDISLGSEATRPICNGWENQFPTPVDKEQLRLEGAIRINSGSWLALNTGYFHSSWAPVTIPSSGAFTVEVAVWDCPVSDSDPDAWTRRLMSQRSVPRYSRFTVTRT